MAFWEWRDAAIVGGADGWRRNGSIVMYNHKNEEIARYNFTDAWPSKWTGPALSAGDDSVIFEELEIQVEGFERVK